MSDTNSSLRYLTVPLLRADNNYCALYASAPKICILTYNYAFTRLKFHSSAIQRILLHKQVK